MDKLILSRDESDLLYAIKGWYGRPKIDCLNVLHCQQYDMEKPCVEGVFVMVSKLWRKYLEKVSPEKRNFLLDQYDELSLPSKTAYVGGKDYGLFPSPEKMVMNEDEMITARILAMVSLLARTEAVQFEIKPIREIEGLKIEGPKVQEKSCEA